MKMAMQKKVMAKKEQLYMGAGKTAAMPSMPKRPKSGKMVQATMDMPMPPAKKRSKTKRQPASAMMKY